MSFQSYTDRCIYCMLFNVKFYTRPPALRWSQVQIKLYEKYEYEKFHFLFLIAIYPLPHTIPLYVFDLTFLKIIPNISCYNFKRKSLPIPYSQAISVFPFFTSICSRNLHHMDCHCLSQCNLNFTHGNQHSKHPEKVPEIDRNQETRWNLFKNIKAYDSSFKRERNRVD